MSYNQALRQVICDQLNSQRDCGAYGSLVPDDILGIDCTWDSGDNYDPTYGSSQSAPTFEFQVRLAADKQVPMLRATTSTVSVSFLMGALFNVILETGL